MSFERKKKKKLKTKVKFYIFFKNVKLTAQGYPKIKAII